MRQYLARIFALFVLTFMLISCWEKQNLSVDPPAHPMYRLYGIITLESTGKPVPEAMIRVTMVDLYQGEYLDPMETMTDSLGCYEFPALYRAQYDIRITQRLTWLYEGQVGIIEYADREYNIHIPDEEESI